EFESSDQTKDEVLAADAQNETLEIWPAASPSETVKQQPDPSGEVFQVLFAILAALVASLLVRMIISFVPARPTRSDFLDRHNRALSLDWPHRVAPTFAAATRAFAASGPLLKF